MRIFCYVVRHDGGYAPNPFGGFLTLATCKPQIRRTASVGDLIVGTGSKQTVGTDRLVYAAKISAVVPIAKYGSLPEYADKFPGLRGETWKRYGDNCYFMQDGEWRQRRNLFHQLDALPKDVSGKNVLVCVKFWYYGGSALEIPKRFHSLIKTGPGHKIVDDPERVRHFWHWLSRQKDGQRGSPTKPLPTRKLELDACKI